MPTGIDATLDFNAGTFIAPNRFLVGAGVLDGSVAKTAWLVIDIPSLTVVATATDVDAGTNASGTGALTARCHRRRPGGRHPDLHRVNTLREQFVSEVES